MGKIISLGEIAGRLTANGKVTLISRGVFSAIFITLLIEVIELGEIFKTFWQGDPVLIGAALALSPAILALKGFRWHLLVKKSGATYWNSLKMVMAGLTLGMFTPGRLGEISRLVFMKRGFRVHGIGWLIGEKIFEVITCGMYSVYGAHLVFGPTVSIGLAVICGVFFFFSLLNISHIYWKRAACVVERFEWIANVLKALVQFDRRIVFSLFGINLIFYFLAFLQLYFLLNAFHPVAPFSVVFMFPLTILINVIPFPTIAGIGPREAAAVFLFGQYGVPGGVAFAATSLWFVINTGIIGIIGYFFWIRERRDEGMGESVAENSSSVSIPVF